MTPKGPDPMEGVREIKLKLSEELEAARKEGKLADKLREIDSRTEHLKTRRLVAALCKAKGYKELDIVTPEEV